jgi:hypothetical protein
MRKHSACLITAAAALGLAAGAVPARAQSFLQGSPDTIPYGNVQLEAAPAQMYAHDGGADKTGAALRLGYGLTRNLDLEAKSGLFDGVTLLGADAQVRLYDRRDTLASFRVGGHHALVRDALDSNALDLSASVGHWFSRRAQAYAGLAYSFEKLDGVPPRFDNTFNRWYAVPGLRFGLANRLDLLVEGGVGLNHDSPHYVTVGFAYNMPVSSRAAGTTR